MIVGVVIFLVLNEIENLALNRENLEVYTSYNKEVNDLVERYIKEYPIYSNLSIIVLNNKGQIVMARGKNYHQNSINTGIYSKRMIGSTIKPFLYYEALNHGMTSLSKFKSEPTTFYINKEPLKSRIWVLLICKKCKNML